MHLVIFGRPGCPFCVRAVDLAQQLEAKKGATYTYVDMFDENLTREDVAAKVGRPVQTVPQILLDESYIGGYTDLAAYVKEQGWLS